MYAVIKNNKILFFHEALDHKNGWVQKSTNSLIGKGHNKSQIKVVKYSPLDREPALYELKPDLTLVVKGLIIFPSIDDSEKKINESEEIVVAELGAEIIWDGSKN